MGEWKAKSIVELCAMGRGRVISQLELEAVGEYPVFSSQTTNNGEMGRINSYDFDGEYVTWTTDGANAGTVFYRSGKFNCTNVCGTLSSYGEIDAGFLSYKLGYCAKKYVSYVGNPKLMNNIVAKIQIGYPEAVAEQSKIAEILSTADESIGRTRALIDKYKNVKAGLMQDLLGNGEMTDFSAVADNITRKKKANEYDMCINMDCLDSGTGQLLSVAESDLKSDKIAFVKGDVLFGKLRPYLRKYCLSEFDGLCSSEIMVFRAKPQVRKEYLYYIVSSESFVEYNNSQTFGTRMPRTSWGIVGKYRVAVPSLEQQDDIIEKVTACDEKIQTERAYLTKLQDIKLGLMQDLLTNTVSVDALL